MAATRAPSSQTLTVWLARGAPQGATDARRGAHGWAPRYDSYTRLGGRGACWQSLGSRE